MGFAIELACGPMHQHITQLEAPPPRKSLIVTTDLVAQRERMH